MPNDSMTDQLSSPADYAAKIKDNTAYPKGYMQLKDVLAYRLKLLKLIEEDHGTATKVELANRTPKQFCADNLQIYRKEILCVSRPPVLRQPRLLLGADFKYTDHSVYGRFVMPNQTQIADLFGSIRDIFEQWLKDESVIIRAMEEKACEGRTTTLIKEPAITEETVPSTGGAVRTDQFGKQIYQRIVIVQRDEENSHNQWAAFLV